MSVGRVLFVGCGPGAADLLTLRAVRALETADVIIWNAALLNREALAEHTRPTAEILQWPPATQRDIDAAYDRAVADGLLVVRLKGGDPTLFGALEPELSAVRERGLACEIVPGVSALSAGGAAIGREVATGTAALLLVDAHSLSEGEPAAIRVAVYGVNRDPRALQRALLARGLLASTPCTVAVDVSRRDEMLVSCTLEELGEAIEDIGLSRLTLVVAGT
jgi:precorrin-4/cobalt-precorrin-4 C11-methyltransferase